MSQPFTNEEYLKGLISGNQKVILEVYDKLFFKVKHFVLKNNGSEQESEEVFQEALCQLITRLKKSDIAIKSSFEAYFFTICKNLWRQELLSKKKWVRNEGIIELRGEKEEITETSEVDDREQRWDLFEQKLQELSENCKELLKDHFNKVPYDEIVRKFNYSSENVAFQRMFKCKKKLKDLIKKDPNFKNLS